MARMRWLTRNHDRDVYRVCTNCGLPRLTLNEYTIGSAAFRTPFRNCWSHSASMCRNMMDAAAVLDHWALPLDVGSTDAP